MTDSKNNSGKENSGDCNSGDCNSGDCNSGDYNSGDCNSGHRNSGDYNSGFFNTDSPTVRMFNKDTGKLREDLSIPYIELPVTEWVTESEMTTQEKKDNPQFYIPGGFLRPLGYKEAWAVAWGGLDEETEAQFLSLPNFDADIFLKLQGLIFENQ